jgi:hypothetical protein
MADRYDPDLSESRLGLPFLPKIILTRRLCTCYCFRLVVQTTVVDYSRDEAPILNEAISTVGMLGSFSYSNITPSFSSMSSLSTSQTKQDHLPPRSVLTARLALEACYLFITVGLGSFCFITGVRTYVRSRPAEGRYHPLYPGLLLQWLELQITSLASFINFISPILAGVPHRPSTECSPPHITGIRHSGRRIANVEMHCRVYIFKGWFCATSAVMSSPDEDW